MTSVGAQKDERSFQVGSKDERKEVNLSHVAA
jgi:hypothetical protein